MVGGTWTKKAHRLFFSLSVIFAIGVTPQLAGQVVTDGSEQPVEARTNQQSDFALQLQRIEALGIIAAAPSRLFWFQIAVSVGPVIVESVISGSQADKAGLVSGDIIREIRRIPHYQRPLTFQSELITAGVVQLGRNIERAQEFGFSKVTLRVQRSSLTLDLVLQLQ